MKPSPNPNNDSTTTTTTSPPKPTSTNKNDDDDDDHRPPTWKIWFLASRPHTLTASLAPVLVGYASTISLSSSSTSSAEKILSLAITFAIFACLIQLGTNLHNDYADFVKGADTEHRVGQARATQKGWLTPSQTATGSTVCLVAALAIGVHLSLLPSATATPKFDPTMLFVALSSVFNAVAYTGGPYPLGYVGLSNVSIGYSGLGDLFVFLYFGIVATVAVPYLVLRRDDDVETNDDDTSLLSLAQTELRLPLIISIPVGCLATAIIVVNNLRDRHTDVVAHKKTLAVRFGRTFARVEYALLMVCSYGMVVLLNAQRRGGSLLWGWTMLPLLSIPLAMGQWMAVAGGRKDGSDLNVHVGGTARVQLVFCVLLALGIYLDGANADGLEGA